MICLGYYLVSGFWVCWLWLNCASITQYGRAGRGTDIAIYNVLYVFCKPYKEHCRGKSCQGKDFAQKVFAAAQVVGGVDG